MIVNHGGVESPDGTGCVSAGVNNNLYLDLQIQDPTNVVDPGDTLEAQGLLAQGIHAHGGNTLLDGLLEDVRFGQLDEGRVDGGWVRQDRLCG